MLFLTLIAFIFICGIVYTVIHFLINPSDGLTFPDNYNKNMHSFYEKVPFHYLWIIIIGPVYEEISFRLGLNFKKQSFIISSLLIIFFVSGGSFIFSSINVSYIINLGVRFGILGLLFILANKYIIQEHLDYLKNHYANFVIYLFAFIFACLHLTNYFPFEWIQIPFYVLIISILFFLAMIFSYIRIKYGLSYAVIFHMLWNLFQTLAFINA